MPQINGYLGRLAKDPVEKSTQSGKHFCFFTVASDEGWGDKKKTDFIPCQAWDKTCDTICKYFKKGSNIIVEGSWSNNPWQKNEKGYDIPNWQLVVRKIHFLPKDKSVSAEEEDFVPFDPAQAAANLTVEVDDTPASANVSYGNTSSNRFDVIEEDEDMPF